MGAKKPNPPPPSPPRSNGDYRPTSPPPPPPTTEMRTSYTSPGRSHVLEMLAERIEKLERAVAKLQRHEPTIMESLAECSAYIGTFKPQLEALMAQASRAGWLNTTEHHE